MVLWLTWVESVFLNKGEEEISMMGFGSFETAKITLGGIEIMAMLKEDQSDVMPLLVRNRVDAFNHLVA